MVVVNSSVLALPLIPTSAEDIPAAVCETPLWPRSLQAPVFFTSQFAPVLGRWMYDGYYFEGNRFQNPNPDLVLEFHFRDDGISRLHWERRGERGFCERLADYELIDGRLHQRVTWVNPANAQNCSSDPDMQNGRDTHVPFERKGDELWLNIGLSGKDFYYILKLRGAEGVE